MSTENAIVPVNTSIARPVMQSSEMIDTAWRLAQFASQSALCKSKNAYDAFFIIQYGYELGLSAMASLRTIHSINGTPACSGEAMLALIRRSKLASEITLTGDTKSAKCRMGRKDTGETYEATFTIEEAKTAGLDKKDNWVKFPAKMLKWRCVSECGKFLFSDVIGGLYTIEEINPNIRITEDGEIAEGEIVPDEPAPVAKHVESHDTNKITKSPDKKSSSTIKTDGTSEVVAWYEDTEKVTAILGHCKAKGWIDGETIAEQRQSLITFLRKDLTDFESGKATVEAAEAVFNAMKNNESPKTTQETTAWDTLDGIAVIVNWAKGKGYGDSEPALLKLLGVSDWKVFADGRAAYTAIEAAAKAQKPAESTSSKKTTLSEIDLLAIRTWAQDKFSLDETELAEKVDLGKYSTITTAKTVIRQKAIAEAWPVLSEVCTYHEKDKYIAFRTELGDIRHYSRSKFHELAGQEYVDANGIATLPDGEEVEIESILLTWEEKGSGDTAYKIVKAAESLVAIPF